MLRDLHDSTRSKRSAAISRRGEVSPESVSPQSSRFMPTTSRFSPCRQMMSEVWTRASWMCAEMTARSSASSAINLSWAVTACTSNLSADALDGGAAGRQFVLKPLETSVEMIDAVDHGLAFRGKPCDHQRHRCPQVGRHDRRAAQLGNALDGGGLAVETNPRAEPRQFLHMHEAIFENRLGDVRGARRR